MGGRRVSVIKFELEHSRQVTSERSYCKVEIYEHNGDVLVFVIEPKDNHGRSVTNAAKDVHDKIMARLEGINWLQINSVTFVEHYEDDDQSWAVVTFPDGNRPVWTHNERYRMLRQEFEEYWASQRNED